MTKIPRKKEEQKSNQRFVEVIIALDILTEKSAKKKMLNYSNIIKHSNIYTTIYYHDSSCKLQKTNFTPLLLQYILP